MKLISHLPRGLAKRVDELAADMGVPPIVVLHACVEFAMNEAPPMFVLQVEDVMRRLVKMPDGRLLVADPKPKEDA